MFTILDGINRFLSYMNFNVKLKNRLYIIFGTFTTGYIGYLTYNFFQHNAYKRAILYAVIFLLLLYFLLLNFIYYFTDKRVKWDISPLFERFIVEEEQELAKKGEPDLLTSRKKKQRAGRVGEELIIYDEVAPDYSKDQIVDTTIAYLPSGQRITKDIAKFMLEHQLVKTDYAGKAEKHLKEKTYAVADGIVVPSFALNKLTLSVGYNAMKRIETARLITIGGIPADEVAKEYTLVPVSVKITGGSYKLPGRSGMMTGEDPYQLVVKVACVARH